MFIRSLAIQSLTSAAFIEGFLRTAQAAALQAAPPNRKGYEFTTGGHTVYHLQPATVDRSGQRAIISATYDDLLMCHTTDGQLRWQVKMGEGFPFDLCVADLDGDGLDEALVASSDGALHVYGPDGARRWVFQRTAPLFQVCVARQKDGRCIVLTGGVEQMIYALSAKGELLGTHPTADCIRLMRAGDVLGESRDVLALTTASSGLVGKLGLLLIDPVNLQVLWERKNIDTPYVLPSDAGHRFYSMAFADVNKDGKKDILLSCTGCSHGQILAYNSAGDLIFEKSDPKIPNIPYRMNLLEPVKLPHDEYIVGQFGNILILYNLDGSCREVVTGPYSFTGRSFDPQTDTFYCGSSVSGGDEIVALRVGQAGWQEAFAQMQPVGRLAEIIRNQDILRAQVAQFQRPDYQTRSNKTDVLLIDEYHVVSPEDLRPPEGAYPGCRFVSHIVLGQKIEPGAFWCQTRSNFCAYDLTPDEIVAQVKQWEASGRDFVVQAAHSSSPHMSLATFQRVLQAAPGHLWGFEFSEVGQSVSPRDREFVGKILQPLAELCRQYGGKKIMFRNKGIFWNANCYVPYWREVLLSGKYRDIFVLGLEETNSRTQELSLAGRIGLWLTGAFDHWACRAETDNACFDRMWEWGGQMVLSHNIRQLVANAAYGSDVFFNSVHQGPFSKSLGRQYDVFYEMLAKGVVQIPQRPELLSVSSVGLGMKEPSPVYLAHGNNLHHYNYPKDNHDPLVFDRLDAYWAAAPLTPDDFSRYAFGVRRRMTNFLPLEPYGMIPIVPADTPTGLNSPLAKKILTDGQYFYDDQGHQHGPGEYRPTVEAALHGGAAKLPVKVLGSAHWIASAIDPDHIRVTLVDPGYLDPADREVEIELSQPCWGKGTDILSGENLVVKDRKISIHIPAGSLRIVDLSRQ